MLAFTRDSSHLREGVNCVIMTHMAFWDRWRRARDEKRTRTELEDRLDHVERTIKTMRLEWDDTYESLAKLSRKLSKREQRALQEGNEVIPEAAGSIPPSKDELRRRARAVGML